MMHYIIIRQTHTRGRAGSKVYTLLEQQIADIASNRFDGPKILASSMCESVSLAGYIV